MAGGARVEVLLVLDPRNNTAFIHRGAGERIGNFTIMEGPYQSLSDTVDAFPSGVSVVFDPFMAQDFPIDPRYAAGMALNQTAALEGALERARSHVRQWEAMQRCWELMNNLILPDVAIRLRDDDAILETFELPDSFGVHAPSCADCNGLNDKGAIVLGTGNMLGYFTMPLQFMRFAFDSLVDVQRQRTNVPLNPESVLLNSMMLAQVPVQRLGPNEAPILPAKFLTDGDQAHLCYFQNYNFRPCIRQEIWTYLSSAGKSIYDDADPSELKFLCESNALQLERSAQGEVQAEAAACEERLEVTRLALAQMQSEVTAQAELLEHVQQQMVELMSPPPMERSLRISRRVQRWTKLEPQLGRLRGLQGLELIKSSQSHSLTGAGREGLVPGPLETLDGRRREDDNGKDDNSLALHQHACPLAANTEAALKTVTEHSRAVGLEFAHFGARDPELEEARAGQDFHCPAACSVLMLEDPVFEKLLLSRLKPADLSRCAALICLDLKTPCTMMEDLRTWLEILKRLTGELMQQLPLEEQDHLREEVSERLANYEEPREPGPEGDSKSRVSDELVLAYNLGIPLVVVVTRADTSNALESAKTLGWSETIEAYLRNECLPFGAAIVYTAVQAKNRRNVEVLYEYLMHRLYGHALKAAPNVPSRDALFVPAGWDSRERVDKTASALEGGLDRAYESVVLSLEPPPPPPPPTVVCDDMQEFLKRSEKVLQRMGAVSARSDKAGRAFCFKARRSLPRQSCRAQVASVDLLIQKQESARATTLLWRCFFASGQAMASNLPSQF
ncbi:unnamed protein product [Durusdinium trenchii]|uniref:Dynein light intermediate chain n=1 Tax=Durusdinium trenchii TaxID=1381693 RepID=A0ABP0KK23_9DINO